MSLKAKIEAVIYAAEEPVTLQQLAGLLGQEAQAELERIASAQQQLDLDEPPTESDPDLLNEEILAIEDDAPGYGDERESGVEVNAAGEQAAAADQVGGPVGEETAAPAPDAAQAARAERERARRLREFLREMLDELIRDYATSERGLEIREVAGGFRLATKPEYHDAVRGFARSLKPPLKLSLQALETLAVVAYKQPVTAPEISEIRGVDSGGVLGSLMARKLVTTAGRKQVIGRPILYKTTKDFLMRFGLKDIQELPSIEEFEKMAGELAENEPVQEEMSMGAENPHTDPELARAGAESVEDAAAVSAGVEEERGATEPQADGDGATVEQVLPDGRIPGTDSEIDPAGETESSAQEADVQRGEERNQP